jgi:ABC-type transport system involved in multi-copper enzyme maturation permease subunit
MFGQLLAIAFNTFFESIRQPIMLVILVAYTIAVIICAPLSGFTMEDDQRMLIDLGLATIFLSGALLAAFIATSVLTREIENRTALTVVSKPVGRPQFVVGKYLGVAAALLLATAYMALVFMLVERHGVLQTVRDPAHGPTIAFGLAAAALGLAAAVWCNYFYGRVFASSVIAFTTPLLALAYFFSLMFGPDFRPQPVTENLHGQLWIALAALTMAILVLAAIAVAVSTRLSQVMTLVVTVGLFLAGMLSDHFVGRPMARLEQTWTARAQALPRGELQRFAEAEADPDELRAWGAGLREEEARAQELATMNATQQAAADYRRAALRDTPREVVEARVAEMWADWERESEARWERTKEGLRRVEGSLDGRRTAHSGDLLVTIDVPQVIRLQTGDVHVNLSPTIHVYPPLLRAQATGSERLVHGLLRIAYAALPNFQILLLSDAVTQLHVIPPAYLGRTALYGAAYIAVALAAGVIFFQRREVG